VDNVSKPCELCDNLGGILLWESHDCRVVRVEDADYPGFCRVIWNAHVREMTDLSSDQRRSIMDIVFGVEQVIRELFSPYKINLASFGNMTPHLHWHVIPRWSDDRHFPEPIWGKIHQNQIPKRPCVSDETIARTLKQYFLRELNHG
jgi:diadenosine tetraphosphate (Ap4A) HIT family hydrolase